MLYDIESYYFGPRGFHFPYLLSCLEFTFISLIHLNGVLDPFLSDPFSKVKIIFQQFPTIHFTFNMPFLVVSTLMVEI